MPSQNGTIKRTPVDPFGGPILYQLMANMIDGPDRRKEMHAVITSKDIPDGWIEAKTLYQCIEDCYDIGGELPTQALMIEMMERRGIKSAKTFVEQVMKERSPQGLVKLPAYRFYDWLQWSRMEKAADTAKKLIINPDGRTIGEVAQEIQRVFANASPLMASITVATPFEQYLDWRAFQIEKNRAKREGRTYNVNFPFKELNELISGIRIGDPILITAASGLGKTTVANCLVEYWAWTQDLYTIYVSQETDDKYLNQRRMARMMGIPTQYNERDVPQADDVIVPMFDPEVYPWSEMDSIMQERLRDMEKLHDLYTISGRGAQVEEVMKQIAHHCEIAAHKGKEVIVVWDYLQKFDWSRYPFRGDSAERLGLARVAQRIKNGTQQLKFRSVVFSQESDSELSGKDIEAGKPNKPKPFGSGEAHKVMQVHLSLQRPTAIHDEEVMWTDPETHELRQIRDCVGNWRYYARKGEPSGENAWLELLKGNDDAPRGRARIRFEGALHLVQCYYAEPKWFPQDLHFPEHAQEMGFGRALSSPLLAGSRVTTL